VTAVWLALVYRKNAYDKGCAAITGSANKQRATVGLFVAVGWAIIET